MLDQPITPGSGCFVFEDSAAFTGASIHVHYCCPSDFDRQTPIVILLHGSDRAARYFRDCWRGSVARYGFLVMAPEFDAEIFPESEAYNRGNVRAPDNAGGGINPRKLWTYPIIDRLFEHVRAMTGSTQQTFSLFGHSAGAQFAHRHIALVDTSSADLVIAGNAGWYMMPDSMRDYPVGTGGLGFNDDALRRFLARPLVLLLGGADTDTAAAGLMRDSDAMAQGPHRLSRGHYYYDTCKKLAERLDAPFNWRLVVAPGVGHEDSEIYEPAAAIISAALQRR